MSGCGDGDVCKWPCGMCTYLNYSTSGRCTMCGNVRPQNYIIPTSTQSSASNVIVTSPPPTQTCSNGEKWSCSQCTYLNYPRAIRCAQCYGLRSTAITATCDTVTTSVSAGSSSPSPPSPTGFSPPAKIHHSSPSKLAPSSPSPSHKTRQSPPSKARQSPPTKFRQSPTSKSRQSPPLKSRLSPTFRAHQASPPKAGRKSPPRTHTSPKVAANNKVNHETQTSPPSGVPASIIQEQQILSHKWCCPACTYENWPRSSRCIMCACPKQDSAATKPVLNCLNNVQQQSPVHETSSQGIPENRSTGHQTTEQLEHCCGSNRMANHPQSIGSTTSRDSISIFSTSNKCSDSISNNVNDTTSTSTNPSQGNQRCSDGSASCRKYIGSETAAECSSSSIISCEAINIINKTRSQLPSPSENHSGTSSPPALISTTVGAPTSVSSGATSASLATDVEASTTPNTSSVSSFVSSSIASSNQSLSLTPSSNANASNSSTITASTCASPRQTSPSSIVRAEEGAVALNNYETEKMLRQLRKRLRDTDLAFLRACVAVLEGNYEPVELYLSSGGDPMRQLTSSDVKLLARPSAFSEGHTLAHLAIRFCREDLLDTILSGIGGKNCGMKRVPCYVAADLATDIRRSIAASLRQRREASFPCYCVSEFVTYSLPPEVDTLGSTNAQDRLWDELLDRDAQKQLEEDAPIINWSIELTDRLNSRLYPLWNRTAGDCLLDSVLQATWGVFDRDNCLRRALASSITEGSPLLYPRWREYERLQARMLDYAVPENQVMEEWAELVTLASQPGAALDQLHIFVLCHILRRPIIVYGVKYVKSFRGEDLGYARFEGVYLPLLWDSSFCCKSPIALGYTRGHFCALVSITPQSLHATAAGAILDPGETQLIFLPLMSHDGKLLPVHFVSQSEIGCEATLLREWLEVCQTDTGMLVAQQKLHKKPLAVAQMTEEWLNHYRTLAQMEGAPFSRPIAAQGYSSDGDSDEE